MEYRESTTRTTKAAWTRRTRTGIFAGAGRTFPTRTRSKYIIAKIYNNKLHNHKASIRFDESYNMIGQFQVRILS